VNWTTNHTKRDLQCKTGNCRSTESAVVLSCEPGTGDKCVLGRPVQAVILVSQTRTRPVTMMTMLLMEMMIMLTLLCINCRSMPLNTAAPTDQQMVSDCLSKHVWARATCRPRRNALRDIDI